MSDSRGGNKEERKELLNIVFEMITKGRSKEEVVTNLQESGLKKKEAEEVYEKVSEDYEESLGEEIEEQVTKVFEEKKERMMGRIDSKLSNLEDNLETKLDLRESEQENYTDKKFKELKSQVEDLKNQVFNLNSEVKTKFKKLKKRTESVGPSSKTQKTVSFILVLAGVVLILYSVLNITILQNLLDKELSKLMVGIVLELTLIIAGILLVKFGKDSYPTKKTKTVEVEGREEKGSWITE